MFDTFGTTADWKSSLVEHCAAIAAAAGLRADWPAFVTEWRSLYQPAIAPVRDGQRLWADFDELHRETLDTLLPKYALNTLSDADRDHMVYGWHLLHGWPDTVQGLTRLRQRHILGALSNGTTRQLVDMAKRSAFPWDVIFGADQWQTYKPAPALYLGALKLLKAPASSVVMVAAHNNDLQAAQNHGLQTAFIHRPTEDPAPTARYTYIATDFNDLATQLGC
ncbi:haloacid dehalogenase type II [Acidipila sp. EB88]|uniref:haloacid dehalogenase type II n=1 Tax=Acidipila sp. EB88 TaxID=2305226 RepID=UPI00210779E5|nr:haloacid dehalogenase type II [Acidipila sp. EB88]